MLTTNSAVKESLVVCQNSHGEKFRAGLVRLTRYAAVFEIQNPALVLRLSEVLEQFQIVFQDRTIYSGRAVVHNLVNTGLATICEVTLDEVAWTDVAFTSAMLANGALREQFDSFMQEWQKLYRVAPEYKVIIADLQSFLADLRLWLDQVEVGIRAAPAAERTQLIQTVADKLAGPVIPCVNEFFERFEAVATLLPEDLRPAHGNYMRRQLHPLMLCAPFANRTFYKPLGYAGDYEMVNMIARNQPEGETLFAQVVNTWFLRQPPAEAHRNRIDCLTQTLTAETLRVNRDNRPARVFNLACGPAREVQMFLDTSPLREKLQITLLDFNAQTLDHVRTTLDDVKRRHGGGTPIEYLNKSIQQILKESGRSAAGRTKNQYDFVYCAGLFDYLSNQVCKRVMNLMYDDWLAPGGLLLVTNVEPSNPLRNGMEYLLDWHLIYRTAAELNSLSPERANPDAVRVRTDATGLNLFLEIRKPS